MVINSTNIYRTNNLILTHKNTRKTTRYDVRNPGPDLGQAQKCGGVKPVNGIPALIS